VRFILLALLFAALVPGAATAHRVNVFAYVEGCDVIVECSYSRSKRVNHGKIEIRNLESDEILLTGETDENGAFRFPVPDASRASGTGLRIVLIAGEGHQNDWVVEASEFMPAASSDDEKPLPDGGTAVGGNTASKPVPPAADGLTRADVEEIVGAALDAKLAPIKRALLEQTEEGPGLREIIGGIGWIFGLVGIAAYFKSRPRV
jgi:nickel transport protein